MADKATPDPTKPSDNIGLMKLNDHKAGMQGLDTERINQIIEEASKGSKFYQHKQKSQERINQKIAELQQQCSKLTEDQKKAARAKVIVKHHQTKVHYIHSLGCNRWIALPRRWRVYEIFPGQPCMWTWMHFTQLSK